MGVRISPPVQNEFKMAKILDYVNESFKELKTQVTWPKWSEVQRLTVVVAVFSVLLALLTYGVDSLFVRILRFLFNSI